MNQILCSTGALIGKVNNQNYKLLEPLSKELACDGFEFMMYSSWYDIVPELIEELCRLSLPIPVMHCEKHIGEKISLGGTEYLAEAIRLFHINCNIAQALQSRKLVCHLWDGQPSDRNFQNNLEAYGELAAVAEQYGIDLLIENVVCNLYDPMKHWCELAERHPDVHFVFDTKMAAFHEQEHLLYEDAYSWLWQNHHLQHYHVNDYAGGYKEWAKLRTLPIGSGHINFRQFFSFIKKTGYEGAFTVEATAMLKDGSVDTAMLNQCFERIREYMS